MCPSCRQRIRHAPPIMLTLIMLTPKSTYYKMPTAITQQFWIHTVTSHEATSLYLLDLLDLPIDPYIIHYSEQNSSNDSSLN